MSGKTLSIFAFFHDVFNFSSPTQTKILKPGKTVKDFSSSSFFPFSSVAKQECRGVKQIGRKKELLFPSICDMIKRKKKKRRNTTEKLFYVLTVFLSHQNFKIYFCLALVLINVS